MMERILYTLEKQRMYCKGSGASAKGFVSVGGFTVLAGSIVSDYTMPSLETGGRAYFNLRMEGLIRRS